MEDDFDLDAELLGNQKPFVQEDIDMDMDLLNN